MSIYRNTLKNSVLAAKCRIASPNISTSPINQQATLSNSSVSAAEVVRQCVSGAALYRWMTNRILETTEFWKMQHIFFAAVFVVSCCQPFHDDHIPPYEFAFCFAHQKVIFLETEISGHCFLLLFGNWLKKKQQRFAVFTENSCFGINHQP